MQPQKFILSIIAVLSIVILEQSCSLDGTCFNQLEVPIKRLEIPDSVAKDSMATIKVIYVTYSNCSKLNNVSTPWEADTMSIHIIADYEGCECPEYLPDSIAIISYKPTAIRNYILRAIKYDGTILQDTLKVY
jgi:hypothetical protein